MLTKCVEEHEVPLIILLNIDKSMLLCFEKISNVILNGKTCYKSKFLSNNNGQKYEC
jgi:hypothetical protein